jgi:hypothetical protein
VEGKKSIWLKPFWKKELRMLERDIVIFAFSLFLAFVLWYINSLGKEIKGEFKFSASFFNIPKARGTITEDLSLKLMVELKGQGYTLLRYKLFGSRNKLLIDLSKAGLKRLPETKPARFYVLSDGLIPDIKKQMGNKFEIQGIKPDTIFLSFNKD